MSGKTGIKVYVPAAISNFGPGLNIISAAVEQPGDEIIASFDSSLNGVEIESIVGFKKGLSKENQFNCASYAANLLLEHLGEKPGIRLRIHKKIGLNSGFSSCAASSVGSVFAVNELLGRPLERYDLLEFAEKGARYFSVNAFPSQSAAILFGGIILYRGENASSFQKLYAPSGLHLSLFMPELIHNEQEKLSFLSPALNYRERIDNAASVAAFISSLYTSDFDLMADSLQEAFIDQGLISAFPFYNVINEVAINQGALGCRFAGLGPGLYIVSPNTLVADEITKNLEESLKTFNFSYKLIQSKFNLNGVYKF